MRILAIVSGAYGERHVENIRTYGPKEWELNSWQAPSVLPPIVDYPEDFLPETLPQADLILSFAEHRGIAELLPDIAKMTDAKAVIAAVDNEAWLPRGLARQLRGWLERINVACATPKPLCSLTESHFGITRRQKEEHNSPLIAAFAQHFGQPAMDITIDPKTRTITAVEVKRDAVCGCARFVAEGLVGFSVDVVEEKAGLLHHHYPCMASMGIDPDFSDTLMHVSGFTMQKNVSEQVKPHRRYVVPGKLREESSGE
jgi:hypothetical protein